MSRKLSFTLLVLPLLAWGEPYDISADLETGKFWTSDPVLFVKKHEAAGFEFTTGERTSAASRLDNGVTYAGLEVYETKIDFGEAGGIARVELILFATGGTEAYQEYKEADGKRFRRRIHVEKTVSRGEFSEIMKTVRATLGKAGAKPSPTERHRTADASIRQASQKWPKSDSRGPATLTWNFTQTGKNTATFKPGFVRLAIVAPGAADADGGSRKAAGKKDVAKGATKITDNVIKDPRGDTFIDNVPMVDQGQKGYCAAATAERVLRYYGLEIDEHEIAQAAGTTVEGGTSTRAMKDSVAAIGRRYRLATVVSYGNFEKSAQERIAGICDEVRAYNKAAKKLKRDPIADDMFIHREGNTIYYNSAKVDEAMDPEVLKEMKVNGMQKSKYTKFMKDIREQVAKGIPLFWGVTLGTYPEPGLQQVNGAHMRLIIGYNDKKREILYSDSWGAGHELKRMPADWAWTISHCLMYLKPLSK